MPRSRKAAVMLCWVERERRRRGRRAMPMPLMAMYRMSAARSQLALVMRSIHGLASVGRRWARGEMRREGMLEPRSHRWVSHTPPFSTCRLQACLRIRLTLCDIQQPQALTNPASISLASSVGKARNSPACCILQTPRCRTMKPHATPGRSCRCTCRLRIRSG